MQAHIPIYESLQYHWLPEAAEVLVVKCKPCCVNSINLWIQGGRKREVVYKLIPSTSRIIDPLGGNERCIAVIRKQINSVLVHAHAYMEKGEVISKKEIESETINVFFSVFVICACVFSAYMRAYVCL